MYYEIRMAIGHHRSDGEPLPSDRVEAAIKQGLLKLTDLFSGGRLHDCKGGYKSIDGHCVLESCSLFTADAEDVRESDWTKLLIIASEIATDLEQECVLITIQRVDGMLHRVKPDASTRERSEQAA